MKIMTKGNVKRLADHAYVICSGNNCSRSSIAQKIGVFRTCERLDFLGRNKSQDHGNYFSKKYKLYNYSLNLGRMAVRSKTVGTSYDSKCKYLRRPVIPFSVPKIETTDIPYYLDRKVLSGILQRQCYTVPPKLEQYKNAGTQTDYRESEAQTEPWEPPYKIVPGHNPEVLTLAHLTWEHGLPAGIHDIHVINRLRMKGAWEAILPPMDTPANIRMRNSIITALEIDRWAFRESEIQFIMDLRLKLMKDLSRNRESIYKKKLQGRFSRLQDKLRKHRDDRVNSIRHDLERDLRKLCRKQCHKRQPRKLDIIEQHADPKSELYAPQLRFGEHSRGRHETLQKRFLSEDYIEQEEEKVDTTLSWLPIIEEPKVIKRELSKPTDICIRESRWTEEKLKQLHSDLKAIRLNVKSVDAVPRLMKRKFKRSTLPVTPRRSGVWDSTQKKREESATFVQKIVKGRAIQCLMYEGRNRCRELIEELQSTQTPEQNGEEELYDEKIHVVESQRLQDDKSVQEDRLCEILNSLEGKTVCGTLDLLSKELVRLKDERRAHAFALLAERERCMREAAEAGTRQMERNRRREFDEMFKQIVKVNQDSVEVYLEDIIKEGIDWVSEETAKEHILELCDKVDDIAKHTSKNANDLVEEELVTDMIYNFVLPEVKKYDMRKKVHDQQQSYMQSAHEAIYEKILELPSIESSEITNQETDIKYEDMQVIFTGDTEQDVGIEEPLTDDSVVEDKK
ncbi:cilia- and flagella-associated protein 91-like isoform X1 [Odontomachus brunneus]|uniref:cilia- and flagella-associated protein 91-like isoform X1 n=1 Tax=Odontomachus brunneus TaxID=486640 RepID=UPI0013F23DCA|nr:cilia- and flagella-associated protein 91-like isoform X1 [Odontomachus brunneus]